MISLQCKKMMNMNVQVLYTVTAKTLRRLSGTQQKRSVEYLLELEQVAQAWHAIHYIMIWQHMDMRNCMGRPLVVNYSKTEWLLDKKSGLPCFSGCFFVSCEVSESI